jgi:hypothetical protein
MDRMNAFSRKQQMATPACWIAACIVLATSSGCLVPARIMTVEDEVLGSLLKPSAVDQLKTETKALLAELAAEPRQTQAAGEAKTIESPIAREVAQKPKPEPSGEQRKIIPAMKIAAEEEIVTPSTSMPQGAAVSQTQRIRSLREISIDITPPEMFGQKNQERLPLPQNLAAEVFPSEPLYYDSGLNQYTNRWIPGPESMAFCYQPLYFEEVNVERYGRNFGVFQPVVSAASFYARIPVLPYMIVAQPARRCTDPAHWTLPGYRISPWEHRPHSVSAGGLASEAGFVAGLILLIP